MKVAKIVFWIAGIWGVLVLTPLYFMFDVIGRQDPPAITHPGFYYGFISVGLAWQVAFFVIARDPVRFRLMIIPAVIEKFGYGLLSSCFICSTGCIPRTWYLAQSMFCSACFFCWRLFERRLRPPSS